jgi:hypothetical protein
MAREIAESDWRLFRKLHAVALERFYARLLKEIEAARAVLPQRARINAGWFQTSGWPGTRHPAPPQRVQEPPAGGINCPVLPPDVAGTGTQGRRRAAAIFCCDLLPGRCVATEST